MPAVIEISPSLSRCWHQHHRHPVPPPTLLASGVPPGSVRHLKIGPTGSGIPGARHSRVGASGSPVVQHRRRPRPSSAPKMETLPLPPQNSRPMQAPRWHARGWIPRTCAGSGWCFSSPTSRWHGSRPRCCSRGSTARAGLAVAQSLTGGWAGGDRGGAHTRAAPLVLRKMRLTSHLLGPPPLRISGSVCKGSRCHIFLCHGLSFGWLSHSSQELS